MQKVVVLKMIFGFLMKKEKVVVHEIKYFLYFQEDIIVKYVELFFVMHA